MTDEELLKKIEWARVSGVTTLDVRYNGLKTMPPEICQLTNLTTLVLSSNQLTTLPPKICQLTSTARRKSSYAFSGNPLNVHLYGLAIVALK